MSETEQIRRAKKLLESLEAVKLACRQTEFQALAFEDLLREEIKNAEVPDTRPLTES